MRINRKSKGNAFIGTIIAIFIILVITLIILLQFKPLSIKSDINQAARKALLKMETTGGMTAEIRQSIIDDLSSVNGFNISDLSISPSSNITESTKAAYGEDITIRIIYTYHYKEYDFVGITKVNSADKTKEIKTELSTTSKNAE